jgi:hypothetical protein
MISEDTVKAYNSRLTIDLGSLKNLTPAQADQVRHYGSQAENLLKNKELALFIHHFKFEVVDALSNISAHTPDANAERVALSNQLIGIDSFVSSLKRAVYLKSRIVSNTELPDTN